MKKIKNSIIVISVVSGCLVLAVIGYAGMGGGHHGFADRFDDRYGDNHYHINGSYHDSNFNDHHRDYYDNYQGDNRSYGHRNRPLYERHSDGITDHEMNNGDGNNDRFPGNALKHRKRSVPER